MGAPRPGHEYVLGTHGAERDRLALQHSLWVDEARQGWRAAGIGRGSRVLDMGCGPGHAMEALLALVGPTGGVTGIELSPEFAAQARTRAVAVRVTAGSCFLVAARPTGLASLPVPPAPG